MPFEIIRYAQTSTKLAYHYPEELIAKINKLEAKKILEISPCTPDATDTRHWVEVYYERYIP